ncbi:hypothetical protein TELCIR_01150 [Teladorsagia circumcincta]|uniref:Uncharacterized protein n=1 Tax=Teladorsagia circumcincta TaxID=45464 RepID=A0A2G9V2Q5_TELCI|nr:hypothetical protein TELCIR_01150 [Teladorsagia circumcincta]
MKSAASEVPQDGRFVISDQMNEDDKAVEEVSEEAEQDDEVDEAGQSAEKEGHLSGTYIWVASELNDDDDDIDNPESKQRKSGRNKNAKTIENRYLEGWLEVKRKKVAKALAARFDNSPVGGKKRDYTSSVLWNIKYLSS